MSSNINGFHFFDESEVKEMVNKHNEEINNFINNELPKIMGKETFTMNDWFKAQEIIKEQNFYGKGMEILQKCRKQGFNVKMNMQSHELVY